MVLFFIWYFDALNIMNLLVQRSDFGVFTYLIRSIADTIAKVGDFLNALG